MKPFFGNILLLLICLLQQEPIVIKLASKPELFTVDKLGNCYVYQNNQLQKYSASGKLVAQFSRLESGKLEFIDVSDPMQLLLFYKDFNQLLFLDNRLNLMGNPINLDDLHLNSVSAVCKSKYMAVWLYDEYENKLIHFGFNPKGIIQTINLDNLSNELSDINFMLESGNELYMNQKNQFVWVFDQFGSKLNKLEITTLSGYQIVGKSLIYNNGCSIFSYHLQNESISTLDFDNIEKFDIAKLTNNHIYILNNDSITIYPQVEQKRK